MVATSAVRLSSNQPGLTSSTASQETLVGTARRLRDSGRQVELISVQPESPLHGLEGLKHMASAIVPGIYDPAVADRNLSVTTEDGTARRLESLPASAYPLGSLRT